MPISSWWIFGNFGGTCPPDRFTKSDGIRTLVRKLRLCQSGRGRKRTRVECCPRGTGPSSRDDWRTIFRRLFLENELAQCLRTILDSNQLESLKAYKVEMSHSFN